jgi:NADH:ubiquinone oxidoreductase subunit 6 (subunit J)
LLNIKIYERNVYFFKYLPATFTIIAALLIWYSMLTWVPYEYSNERLVDYVNGFNYIDWQAQLYVIDVLAVVGYMMFTYYWFVAVLLSLLLLMAIVSSVVLTFNNVSNFKKQETFKQIESGFKKTLKFKTTKCL